MVQTDNTFLLAMKHKPYFIVAKHSLFPSLCIRENHGTILGNNFFLFDCETSNCSTCKSCTNTNPLLEPEPELSNEGKISCSRKKLEPLLGLI